MSASDRPGNEQKYLGGQGVLLTFGQLLLVVTPSVPTELHWACLKSVNLRKRRVGEIGGVTIIVHISPLALHLCSGKSAVLHGSARGQERSHYTNRELKKKKNIPKLFPKTVFLLMKPNPPAVAFQAPAPTRRGSRPEAAPAARRLSPRPCPRPVLSARLGHAVPSKSVPNLCPEDEALAAAWSSARAGSARGW